MRQWTQLLVDHSLLLGSSTKGVHLHDIVLTYLRNTPSALELRALQKNMFDGIAQASRERRAATGHGLQDTGGTAQAFEGEEVDWYACNVGSFHIKQSMDPAVALVQNEDVKRWLFDVEGEAVFRQTALALVSGLTDFDDQPAQNLYKHF